MARNSILDDPATYAVYKRLGPERFAEYLTGLGYGTDEGIGGVDEEDTTDSTDTTGTFAARPSAGNVMALRDVLSGQRQSISDLYDKITSNITQRYRQPGLGDLLTAIGTGMMTPPGESDRGGFAGSIQRGLQGVGTYAKQRGDYQDKLNEMLAQIDIKKATALGDLEQKYLAAAAKGATPTPLKSVIVEAGTPYDPISGEKIVQPSDAAWAALAADPTPETYNSFVREFGPRFAEKAQRILSYAAGGQ